jgi:hypothetical protein
MKGNMDKITNLLTNQDAIQDIEYFARNFAALGQCMFALPDMLG